jgi:sulfatase maturation enzyme AslB (radical SAM superfamily)
MFDFVKKLSYYPEKLQIALSNEIGRSLSTVFLDLSTKQCNFDCVFCDSKFYDLIPQTFPRDVLFRIADDLKTMGVDSVLLCGEGGEPMLNPHFVEVASRLYNNGCSLGIYTNGSCYDDSILRQLKNFEFVRVSLNAGTSNTYQYVHGIRDEQQFSKTLSFIQKASEINRKVGVSFLIIEDNIDEMYMATQISRDLGVRFIEFKPAYQDDYSVGEYMYSKKDYIISQIKRCQSLANTSFSIVLNNQLSNFLEAPSQSLMTTLNTPRRCIVSKFRLVISPSGYYLCTPHHCRKEYRLGDPYKETVEQVWFGERHKELLSQPCSLRCTYHEQNEFLLKDYSIDDIITQNTSITNMQKTFL